MELQAGKKYCTEYGIGLAFDSDEGYMKMYFYDVEGDDGRPVYYVKGQHGRSNINWITAKYDAIEEVKE